jgi:zinc and cadmium transporter
MLQQIPAPLLFGLAAAVVTTIGLILMRVQSNWGEASKGGFELAAAGMLIGLSVLHMLPEALHRSPHALWFILGGFTIGLGSEQLMRAVQAADVPTGRMAALTPVLAIALHSTLDGAVYAVSFAADYASGVYTALSLILHEVPEGIVAYAILSRHGFSQKAAFGLAFLAAAATTPLGALIAAPMLVGVGAGGLAALYALSAGLLVYVATGPLLVPLRHAPSARGALAVVIGAGLAAGLHALPIGAHAHAGAPGGRPGPAAAP